jgi:hypothetical protein
MGERCSLNEFKPAMKILSHRNQPLVPAIEESSEPALGAQEDHRM